MLPWQSSSSGNDLSVEGGGSLINGRRTAQVYEAFMGLVTLGSYRSFVSREASRLRPNPKDRAVDICCGTGLLTRALARSIGPKGAVVGVDASEAMLDAARSHSLLPTAEAAAVSFILADASRLPLPGESVDLATMFLGLHEIAPSARLPALREVQRVLRPGGRGLILDVSSSIPRPLLWPARVALIAMEGSDAWNITDPGVPALLRQAGLRQTGRRAVLGGILELVEFSRPLKREPLPPASV